MLKAHGLVPLFGCFVFVFLVGTALATFSRRHIYPVFAVGRDKIVWNDFEQLQLARRVEGRMPGIIRYGTGSGLLSVSAPGQPDFMIRYPSANAPASCLKKEGYRTR